jgi:hypothetical protein
MYIHTYILHIKEKNIRNTTSRFSKFGDDQYVVNLDSDITLFLSRLLPTIKLVVLITKNHTNYLYHNTCKIVKKKDKKIQETFFKGLEIDYYETLQKIADDHVVLVHHISKRINILIILQPQKKTNHLTKPNSTIS